MGQIDLFEHDHNSKSPSDLLDDKALSEILEVPDDNLLSEMMELPDFTEGELKADSNSDVSEVELKVETKDCVRLECDMNHGNELSQTDANLVAHLKSDNEGVELSDHNSLVAQPSLGNDGLVAQQSLVPPGAQTAHDQTLSGQNGNDSGACNSEVISTAVKTNNTNEGKSELENVVDSKSQKPASKVKNTNTDLSPANRCMSPYVDISIPPKPKSNSLASRKSKVNNPLCVLTENVQKPNQVQNSDHLASIAPNAKSDKSAVLVKTESTGDTRIIANKSPPHLREKSESSGSFKVSKPNSCDSAKHLEGKRELDLAKKEKIEASAIKSVYDPVAKSHPKSHSQWTQGSRFKQNNVIRARDKSPSAKVYLHSAEKPRSHQHQAEVSVKDETVNPVKGKPSRTTRMEAMLKSSKKKPAYV